VLKFNAFIAKNTDMPYCAKKKVFTSALSAAILYGNEAWLSDAAIKIAQPMYASSIRTLLGVRRTTATDLCLIEAGLQPLAQTVKNAQKRTLVKLMSRTATHDDPFETVYRLCRESRTPCARYIDNLLEDRLETIEEKLRRQIRNSERTKYITYRTLMNPNVTQPDFYAITGETDLDERRRITTTRFRLSSHNLAIERGRWSRTPRQDRLCPCGQVQDEQHVISDCRDHEAVRRSFPNMTVHLPEF
jgi:hypothetical protein